MHFMRALLCALLLAASLAAAATPRAPYLSLDRYGLDQGLSQLAVTAFAEDPRGFLWIGTQEGLNRFDGHRFDVFGAGDAGSNGLVSSSIDSLAVDGRGRLWIGTNDAGLEVRDLASGERRRLGLQQPLSHRSVRQILPHPDGGAWLGTVAGIDFVDDQVAGARPLAATARIVGLRHDAHGAAYALDQRCRLWTLTTEAAELQATDLPDGRQCVALQPVQAGLWIGTTLDGLYLIGRDGRVLRHLPAAALHPGGVELTALGLGSDRQLLAGYLDGRVLGGTGPDGMHMRAIAFDRAPSSAITGFFAHRAGVLFLGTHTSGLYRVRALSAAIRRDLLPDEAVVDWPSQSIRAIWQDDRQLLVGTDAGLLWRRPKAVDWQRIDPIGATSVRVILANPAGGWWIGSHRGLWQLDPDGHARALSGLPDNRVSDLLLDGEVLWIATRGGLARLRGGAIDTQGLPIELDGQFLTSLMRDEQGRLWIGSNDQGVYRLGAQGALELLNTRNGGLPHDSIWSLYGDRDAWWLGSFAGGLIRIDRETGAQRTLSDRDGLSNNVVYRIMPDSIGRLWLSTNNGLNVVDPVSGLVQALLRGDGLRNREYNSGAAFADRRGLLWFGGTEGVDIIEPLRLTSTSPPATPALSGLRVFGRSAGHGGSPAGPRRDIAYADRVEFDYRDRVFSLDLTAIDFSAPEAARLRYRIGGVHEDWVQPPGPRAELLLSYLPAGHYTLEVEAAGRDGRFGPPRRLTLSLEPPPWEHPLAYLAYALLVLAAGAALGHRVRARMNAERRQIDHLNRTVELRTAELEDANRRLLQSNRRLELAIRTDPLTQVSNRRDLQEWFEREGPQLLQVAAEPGHGTLFFMIDLDDFKQINDRYGHQVGDQVLVAFADRLRQLCRERDILVRWGGEEFLMLLRNVRLDEAGPLAERIRRASADRPIETAAGPRLATTCSIGFAPWPLDPAWPALGDWEQSIALADRALYAAKASGKNAWVGLLPGPAADRADLLSLLGGTAPQRLPEGSVLVLHSTDQPPRFERDG